MSHAAGWRVISNSKGYSPMMETLSQAGIVAKLSMAVPFAPLIMAIVYAVRPTEGRLALMRPLSLAAIFAALSGFSAGLIAVLRGAAATVGGLSQPNAILGLSEASVPLFVGFGCLTASWLFVTLGLRREQP
jgi:hypothetical protein